MTDMGLFRVDIAVKNPARLVDAGPAPAAVLYLA